VVLISKLHTEIQLLTLRSEILASPLVLGLTNGTLLIPDYEKAWKNGKEYTSIKGPGSNAKPHEHLFFRKLGPIVKRTLDKCVRENGFM